MSDLDDQGVGDYRLELALGAGAVGRTYRARHLPTGRAAAVKVLHPRLAAHPGFAARFERETRRAAALSHPGIVAIERADVQGGRFYVATAYCPDGSLRGLIERRDDLLPLARGVHLVRDAAAAVAAAHAQRVLHRDIKPENVLIARGASGRAARVTDFHLTRLAETGDTGGDVAIGSPAYLSPEQCGGTPVDARSDVYSLGVVLYEVASGHPPFQVRTIDEAREKHLNAVPHRPSAVGRDRGIPPGLDAVVLRCLAKAPADRFQTAAAVADALDEVLAELQERSRPMDVEWEDDARRGAQAGGPEDRGGRRRVRLHGLPVAPTGAPPAPDAVPATRPPTPAPPVGPPPNGRRVHLPGFERGGAANVQRPPADAVPPPETRRVSLVLDARSLELTPGTPATVVATVVNTGELVDHFDVIVDGVPGDWLVGPPAGVELVPGARGTVTLTILVPAAPASHARPYPVTVRARARRHAAESASAECRWTVLPFWRVGMTLVPARVQARWRARFEVALENQSNAPVRFVLSGADEEHRVRFEFADGADGAVELAAGTARDVPLAAVAPLRWLGATETRTLTVRAEALPAGPADDGGAAAAPGLREANAQFVQRALIPAWVPRLVIPALALLLALALWTRDRARLQVAVTPDRVQLRRGATVRLGVTVTNKAGEPAADQTVRWSTSDSVRATVSDSGVVRARGEGTAVITARRGKVSATAVVDVGPPVVVRVALSKRALALDAPNGKFRLGAVPYTEDGAVADAAVTFTSSDPAVATVGGDGLVVAKGAGSATITAQAESKIATANVTVTGPPVAAAAGAAARPAPAPGGGGGGGGAPSEDCVTFNPNALRVARIKGTGYVVTDGITPLLTLESDAEARRALAVAQRHTARCFLGRASARPNKGDVLVEYWIGDTGARTAVKPEDCAGYDRDALRTIDLGASGILLADAKVRLLAADTPADAARAMAIAKAHTALCFIGRGNRQPNPRAYMVQYWK